MTQQTIISKSSGKQYTLWMHNSKVVGCSCEARKYNVNVACKHMKQATKDAERTAYNNYELSLGVF